MCIWIERNGRNNRCFETYRCMLRTLTKWCNTSFTDLGWLGLLVQWNQCNFTCFCFLVWLKTLLGFLFQQSCYVVSSGNDNISHFSQNCYTPHYPFDVIRLEQGLRLQFKPKPICRDFSCGCSTSKCMAKALVSQKCYKMRICKSLILKQFPKNMSTGKNHEKPFDCEEWLSVYINQEWKAGLFVVLVSV